MRLQTETALLKVARPERTAPQYAGQWMLSPAPDNEADLTLSVGDEPDSRPVVTARTAAYAHFGISWTGLEN